MYQGVIQKISKENSNFVLEKKCEQSVNQLEIKMLKIKNIINMYKIELLLSIVSDIKNSKENRESKAKKKYIKENKNELECIRVSYIKLVKKIVILCQKRSANRA